MELYHYSSKKFNYSLIREKQKDGPIKKFKLTYDSPYRTGVDINDRVYARLFFNKKTIKKNTPGSGILILVHGFSSRIKSTYNYYRFISRMAGSDLSCAFINLPFHLNRTPEGEKSGRRMIYYDDVETLRFFHQGVVDIKRLIDILLRIFSVKNIYISGISLGSMVALIAMANDSRINKGIFLLGGGNWKEIHWNGILRFILKGDCTHKGTSSKETCSRFYSNFPEFLNEFKKIKNEKIKMDLEGLPDLKKATTKMCFLCDPLAFAHKIKPEKVLMINSKFDFYFSGKSTKQLWEKLGRPKIHWLNSPHSGKILTNEKIIAEIKQFLQGT